MKSREEDFCYNDFVLYGTRCDCIINRTVHHKVEMHDAELRKHASRPSGFAREYSKNFNAVRGQTNIPLSHMKSFSATFKIRKTLLSLLHEIQETCINEAVTTVSESFK